MSALSGLNTWLALALLAGVLGMQLLALCAYQRFRQPPPEAVRKLYHLSGGLILLSLPWLFDEVWPILLLSGLATLTFLALRYLPALHAGAGQVLHAVPRQTLGEFYFVLGITLAFLIAEGDKVRYVVPVLVLAVADTTAALVGLAYGRTRIRLAAGWKSAEGSLAFFLTAFLCVHIPVLIGGATGRLESLLIGTNLAILLMLAEAISWKGADNLVLPLLVAMLLGVFVNYSADALLLDLAVIAVLSLCVLLWRKHSTLANDALIGSVLAGYVFWAVGGWHWLLSPLMLYFGYVAVMRGTRLAGHKVFHIPVLIAVLAPGLGWLLAWHMTGMPLLQLPYAASFAASFALIDAMRERTRHPQRSRILVTLRNAILGALITLPMLLTADGLIEPWLVHLGLLFLATLLGTGAFNHFEQSVTSYTLQPLRWLIPCLVAASASTLCFAFSFIWSVWNTS